MAKKAVNGGERVRVDHEPPRETTGKMDEKIATNANVSIGLPVDVLKVRRYS